MIGNQGPSFEAQLCLKKSLEKWAKWETLVGKVVWRPKAEGTEGAAGCTDHPGRGHLPSPVCWCMWKAVSEQCVIHMWLISTYYVFSGSTISENHPWLISSQLAQLNTSNEGNQYETRKGALDLKKVSWFYTTVRWNGLLDSFGGENVKLNVPRPTTYVDHAFSRRFCVNNHNMKYVCSESRKETLEFRW